MTKMEADHLTALPMHEKHKQAMSQLISQQTLFPQPMVRYFLGTELFNQGIRPAVNVGLSVSRARSANAQQKL